MCGIGGMYRMGADPIREWQITMLANNLEYRGNDATGVALIAPDGHISLIKNADQAWKFTSGKAYREFMAEHLKPETQIVLVHTRKATKGLPYRNENNHPIYGGQGVIIHNGMIHNDDELFRVNSEKPAFKRSCETDSDVIRALLDNFVAAKGTFDRELIREFSLLRGVAAIAACHPKFPGKLLLMRDSNPLMIAGDNNFLYFASDKHAIHCAAKPWIRRHNILMQVHAPNLAFVPMANQTGWIIGPGGYEEHEHFRCNGAYSSRSGAKYPKTPTYIARHERFKERAKDEIAPPTSTPQEEIPSTVVADYVICPNGACNHHVQLSEAQQNAGIDDLVCGACETPLKGAVHATFLN